MKKIISKFKSTCSETGKPIKKGEKIAYDYSTKKVYCESSQTYKNFNSEDQAGQMIKANENAYFDNFCLTNNI